MGLHRRGMKGRRGGNGWRVEEERAVEETMKDKRGNEG
jgi:hypothetical protein